MPTKKSANEIIIPVPPRRFNRVHGDLWMGEAPAPVRRLSEEFDCLVLCAKEYQIPDCFPNLETFAVPLYDDGEPMRQHEYADSVRAAAKVMRWLEEGKRVLVTCSRGWNRSGLVCAIALCKGMYGLKPSVAIEKIRRARGPNAMSNEDFVNFLFTFCGASDEDRARSGGGAVGPRNGDHRQR